MLPELLSALQSMGLVLSSNSKVGAESDVQFLHDSEATLPTIRTIANDENQDDQKNFLALQVKLNIDSFDGI